MASVLVILGSVGGFALGLAAIALGYGPVAGLALWCGGGAIGMGLGLACDAKADDLRALAHPLSA